MKKNNSSKKNSKYIKILLEAAVSALIWCIVIYVGITKFNSTIVNLLVALEDSNGELAFVEWLFPIIFVVLGLIKIGDHIILESIKNKFKDR